MSIQVFQPWAVPAVTALGKMAFEGITYAEGMRIHLREIEGERRRVCLEFRDLPTAVRIANESMRLATLPLLPKNTKTSFFLVENSEFLGWLNNDSLDIYAGDPIFHLAIVTEEWLDIICNEDPVVTYAE